MSTIDLDLNHNIEDIDVSAEMRTSYLEYAMSVIVARALPDVRDGLKPVHRRILYGMYTMGLRPDTAYKKSARVTGEVMGKYHPHGNTAIYDSLVRLAQDFYMSVPLVDGHGNFGTIDLGPAAERYTECRLTNASVDLIGELGENAVDFVDNYDNTETEPEVLASAFPNLLVNGSYGIAVGMATNMAPHNLSEAIEVVLKVIQNPDVDLDTLMKIMPAPDFPTGGIIIGSEGIKEAYETGKGSFRIRAKASIEQISPKRKGIVVTELPYGIGPDRVIDRVKDLVDEKKLLGVSNITNYSDRKSGLRLVLEVKNGFSPEVILTQLYKESPLEISFSINNVALVNYSPRVLGLKDICRLYIEHRQNVVQRRTQFRLDKAKARSHIVEGLITAISAIDEVVLVIKKSKTTESARNNLQKTFSLSQLQAQAVLDTTLKRLTSLEVGKLEQELLELKKSISNLENILSSTQNIMNVVSAELRETSRNFGKPRKSQIIAPEEVVSSESLDTGEETTGEYSIGISLDDKILYNPSSSTPVKQLISTSLSEIGVITNKGVMVYLSRTLLKDNPITLTQFSPAYEDHIPVIATPLESSIIFMGTKTGVIKAINRDKLPKRAGSVISLGKSDEVIGGFTTNDETDVIWVTSKASALTYSSTLVRPQGASGAGVTGIKLKEDDGVIYFGSTGSDHQVVTVTNTNGVKLSKRTEFPDKGRATGGVRCHTFKKGETHLIGAISTNDKVGLFTDKQKPIKVQLNPSRRDASSSATVAGYKYIGIYPSTDKG